MKYYKWGEIPSWRLAVFCVTVMIFLIWLINKIIQYQEFKVITGVLH